MVFDTECMLSDPVAMTDRCEKEKEEGMRQRHAHIDRRFAKVEDREDLRAAQRIQTSMPHISEAEALTALSQCNNDEKMTVKKLHRYDFLLQIRKQVCAKIRPLNDPGDAKLRNGENKLPRTNAKGGPASSKTESPGVDVSEWSEARKLAWAKKDEMPNTYLYCYTEPGEEQKHGKWSKEEHELFMLAVAEAGGWDALRSESMKWGLFSRSIPGRVGYQCSNYFLLLERRKRASGRN